VDEDEPNSVATTKETWETKANKKILADTDELLKLVKEVQPNAALNYNRGYIGLVINGDPKNFVRFIPRKAYVIVEFKLPDQSDDIKGQLGEAGISLPAYDSQFGFFRVKIDPPTIAKQPAVLRNLVKQAWEDFGKP
jgi:hypothetical protein